MGKWKQKQPPRISGLSGHLNVMLLLLSLVCVMPLISCLPHEALSSPTPGESSGSTSNKGQVGGLDKSSSQSQEVQVSENSSTAPLSSVGLRVSLAAPPPTPQGYQDQEHLLKRESVGPSGVVDGSPTHTPTAAPPDYPNNPTLPHPEYLHRNGTISLRGACNSSDQCSANNTECRLGKCKCESGYTPQDTNYCGVAVPYSEPTTDPTMIGVIIGLCLMSVTMCVVMRLFAKARFQENRTIFNTPNPRLMNASLLKGGKKLGRGNSAGRRGSQGSVNSQSAEGGGSGGEAAAPPPPALKVQRVRPSRQKSTDTTDGGGGGSRPAAPLTTAKGKSRQDSVASNV